VWLIKKNINASFVLVPMFFMFTVTLTSLGIFAWHNFQQKIYLLAIIATGMFLLSVVLIILARQSLKKENLIPAANIRKSKKVLMDEKK
jgi:carbon starvation protein